METLISILVIIVVISLLVFAGVKIAKGLDIYTDKIINYLKNKKQ